MNSNKNPLLHGLRGKCPNCGQGRLFKSYITQNQVCSICREDFSNIHADDGPPWLTILVSGHIMAPLIIYFVTHDIFSEFIETSILIIMALLCVFIILPRAKGLFIAAIWIINQNKKKED